MKIPKTIKYKGAEYHLAQPAVGDLESRIDKLLWNFHEKLAKELELPSDKESLNTPQEVEETIAVATELVAKGLDAWIKHHSK